MLNKFDISDYDYYVVMFSGGKDSTACFLYLLDLGIPRSKIELWHHLVDGQESSLMDWECTTDYCKKFASAFNVSIYYSWKQDGFLGEMLRVNSPTKPCFCETPNGLLRSGGKGKPGTRLKFPQISADLSVRWCSAYLKIDVASAAIRNQVRFIDNKVLIISGERAEESSSRKNYEFFERDKSDNRRGIRSRRHVDRCRIIHPWTEADVWAIIRRYKVVVHPCYYLGYSRCSCKWCIFGNSNQLATSFYLSPAQGERLARLERQFRKTVKKDIDLMTYIERGIPYDAMFQFPAIAAQAITHEYKLPIFTDYWMLPAGAYSRNIGPT